MIELTRLNQKTFTVNCDLIEMIEETPDSVVTLTNGKKLIVTESAQTIIEKVIAFRYRCQHEGKIQIKTGDELSE